MKASLLNKVLSTISHFGMLQKGDSVLISISGGPDSVFLAHALSNIKAAFGLDLYCFHLDHRTRNGQSHSDAEFVKNFCDSTGLKLFSVEMDAREWCSGQGLSFQEGARRLRLNLLNETAKKNHIKKIATGHTADDNVETFLMHLLRGSGLRGLSGIQPVSHNYIRPLIEIFHSCILDYLAENKIPYCTDKTNLENIYHRNKIRNVLIPFINSNFSKNFVKNLSGTIDVIRQENEFFDTYGRKCLEEISEVFPLQSFVVPGEFQNHDKKGFKLNKAFFNAQSIRKNKGSFTESIGPVSAGTIKIPLVKLRPYPESVIRRIIISAIELLNGDFINISRRNLADITRLCFSGTERKALALTGGISVIRESDNLYLYNRQPEAKGKKPAKGPDTEITKSPGSSFAYTGSLTGIHIEIGSKKVLEISGSKYLIEAFWGTLGFLKAKDIKSNEAYLDFEKIRFPLKVDNWHKAGEKFIPLGLKDFKKIQDYFTDLKIPYSKRPGIPLFYDRDKIIWVAGLRIDERVKIDKETKIIFHIKIIDI